MKKRSTRRLVAIGVLSSVAAVLMFFEFPLTVVAADFYKLDLSEVPALVGAFAYGPVAGLVIEVVKIIVKTSITGSMTMGVGEVANFLIGAALIVPAALIYQRKKSAKSAVYGMGVGILSMVTVGAILNAFVLLPAFAYFLTTPEYTVTISDFVFATNLVNPLVTDVTTMILFSVVPFNLIKGLLVSAIVILIYKRISIILKSKDSDAV